MLGPWSLALGGHLSAEQVFVEHPWLAGDQDFCVMARRIIAGGEVDL